MITLSERLTLELRNRDPSEITELILDNSKANEIEGLDDSYINLRELSLVNVGLTTLKGFPSLPSLEKLDLSDNKLSFGLENLVKCPLLMQLLLTNNRIKSFKDVESLASLSHLEILDLFNCAISSEENYRKEIFALIPSLKYLDGFDEKNEEELNESEEYDEEEENEGESDAKDVYEISDETASDDEYETDEGDGENRNSGKASNTRGKDMNLYRNEDDVVEVSDDDGEQEDYDVECYDENTFDEIIETNGKSKNADYASDCDDVLSTNTDSVLSYSLPNVASDANNGDNLSNGLKRNFEVAFSNKHRLEDDGDEDADEDDDDNSSVDYDKPVKQTKNNSSDLPELTDDSPLLDQV